MMKGENGHTPDRQIRGAQKGERRNHPAAKHPPPAADGLSDGFDQHALVNDGSAAAMP
jgi:hypothetical protein